ncbi:hypothetical protein ACFORL_03555 [Legionella dresdenensis]|uniref:Substrate of the Dot/Icm secretion system n=1 Tax=Legionella dresdenensis TaxID=450200 RepID=A0ABV8CCV0_9GAMM
MARNDKLSDSDLSNLYLYFSNTFKERYVSGNAQQVFHELWNELFYWVTDPNCELSQLPYAEKQRAFLILDTAIKSLPEFRQSGHTPMNFFIPPAKIEIHVHHHHHKKYRHFDNVITEIFLWGALWNYLFPSYTHNSHGHNNNAFNNFLYRLISAVAVIVAVGAFYYLIGHLFNGFERMLHNEGWMQATVSLASTLAGAAGGALLGYYVVSVPLMMLGFSLGMSNPAALAILGIVALTAVSAAIFGAIGNWAADKNARNKNPDALVQNDPYRFRLTDEEAAKVEAKGYNSDVAKCAIVDAAQKIAENKGVNNRIYRVLFTNGRREQRDLEVVRTIREDKLTNALVSVAGKTLNLRVRATDSSCPPEAVITEHFVARGGQIPQQAYVPQQPAVYIPDMPLPQEQPNLGGANMAWSYTEQPAIGGYNPAFHGAAPAPVAPASAPDQVFVPHKM